MTDTHSASSPTCRKGRDPSPRSMSGQLLLSPDVGTRLGAAITACTSVLYDETWQRGARTTCVFTSMVLAASLRRMGFAARPTAVTLAGEYGGLRFGVGHPDFPITHSSAWHGHMVCMVETVLIDATISQIRRFGLEAPLLVAIGCAEARQPDVEAILPSGVKLRWNKRGANEDWIWLRDASSPVWQNAVGRLFQRLGRPFRQPSSRPPASSRQQAGGGGAPSLTVCDI